MKSRWKRLRRRPRAVLTFAGWPLRWRYWSAFRCRGCEEWSRSTVGVRRQRRFRQLYPEGKSLPNAVLRITVTVLMLELSYRIVPNSALDGNYSERRASTGLTLAARAAGTADAITAAARMTNAEIIKRSTPGSCTWLRREVGDTSLPTGDSERGVHSVK